MDGAATLIGALAGLAALCSFFAATAARGAKNEVLQSELRLTKAISALNVPVLEQRVVQLEKTTEELERDLGHAIRLMRRHQQGTQQ